MAEQNIYTHYSAADIEKYLQGRMNAKEMHELERAALQDPFLADAIEGYRAAAFTKTYEHLDEIAAALQAEKQQARVIAMPVKANYWWKVAIIILIVAAAGIAGWYGLNTGGNSKKLMVAQQKPAANTPAPATDSLIAKNEKTVIQPLAKNEKRAENKMTIARHKEEAAPPSPISKPQLTPGYEKFIGDSAGVAKMNDSIKLNMASAGFINQAKQANADKVQKPIVTQELVSNNATANNANVYKNASPYNNNALPGPAFNSNKIPTDSIKLNIVLSPSPTPPEVTITDLRSKMSFKKAAADTTLLPQGGWESFNDYVFRKTHKAVDTTATAKIIGFGNVEIEFTIDDSGIARDLKVTKSLDKVSDAKALEIVKQWPGWITTKKDKKGKVLIRF